MSLRGIVIGRIQHPPDILDAHLQHDKGDGRLKPVPFVFQPCSPPYLSVFRRDVGHLETRLDEASRRGHHTNDPSGKAAL